MSTRRTERLVNLVICLLSTRQFLQAARIRDLVPGYEASSQEAFQRMFERDKAELRDLGIPLETGTNSTLDSEAEVGYRIARRDYELPEVHLEPDEAAAVGLAARLWQSGLSAAASTALVKLRAVGIDVDAESTLGVEPVVDATEPALAPCLAALRSKRTITFAYRTANSGTPEQRQVDPWGVVSRRGKWYVAGHDRGRGAARVFRLSRISGDVVMTGPAGAVRIPPDLDLLAMASSMAGETGSATATVRVRRGAAAGLRRQAREISRGEESDLIEVLYSDPAALAEQLTGYADDVVVIRPAEVRAAVIAGLRALSARVSP